ncbi:hypothetical protein [Actinokineospora sp.]|uniref:hypothetical protein n=1 Tax=Actinokineospora sp. TaxID=1872133 RepID=UPI003D6B146A
MAADTRTAAMLDNTVRTHLAMLLTGTQCGSDSQVLALARMETHRLVGAVLAALRDHALDSSGRCTVCGGRSCCLRTQISHSLLPVRPPAKPDGG